MDSVRRGLYVRCETGITKQAGSTLEPAYSKQPQKKVIAEGVETIAQANFSENEKRDEMPTEWGYPYV